MRSSALILVVLATTASCAFVYNEVLATEEAALSFAAYCPDTAINSWSVGYVSTNYPNIANPLVFENNIAVNILYKFRELKDTLPTIQHIMPSLLSSEDQVIFKTGWITSNSIRLITTQHANAKFTVDS